MEKDTSTVVEAIKANGLRTTHQRERVLEELMHRHGPYSIDELYKVLSRDMHRVTLYRILDEFVEAGIVYQTDFQEGKAYFEYQRTHHHHVVCTSCGYKEHISLCPPVNVTPTPGFTAISHHMLEFFGTCKKCTD